jgi:3-methyl-2-oxobutanoate hydroxymethyltransferase
MGSKITAPDVFRMKGSGDKVVCITAYDSTTARIADKAGADLILVGDSVANTLLGLETTLGVDLATMVHHTRAVASSVSHALLVADMPFGSYQSSVAQAVDSAIELVKAGAHAVKLEGEYAEAIEAICKAGIPVMGHVGMTPQSVHSFGGFRVQGKDNKEIVLEAARSVDRAGVFSMVIELVPAGVAKEITEMVICPTIGIGAGPNCDGEIQVFHDIVGLSPNVFRHSKRYCDGASIFESAITSYVSETRSGNFPTEENSF